MLLVSNYTIIALNLKLLVFLNKSCKITVCTKLPSLLKILGIYQGSLTPPSLPNRVNKSSDWEKLFLKTTSQLLNDNFDIEVQV